MVKITNLTFYYKKGFNVLDDINLEIKDGEYVAIIGPNGGGKSTLIKLLLNFLKPKSGKIELGSKSIGYVPQHTTFSLDIPITVMDIVLQARLSPFKIKYSQNDIEKALNVLKTMKVENFKDKKIADLSGGQRQRVLIARALATDPDILILDEPTSAIDIKGQKEIYKILSSLNITRIIVSHDINILLEGIDKVAFINKNLIIHNAPDLSNVDKSDSKHFCEVELINYLKGGNV